MSEIRLLVQEVKDITQCPICMEVMKYPKVLPCLHTFCLECLEEYGKAKEEDVLPCPMCRCEFTIPANGMNGLGSNFFIEKLIAAQCASRIGIEKVLCRECSVDKIATNVCVDCQENVCDQCTGDHRVRNVTTSHQIMPLKSVQQGGARGGLESGGNMCDKHLEEEVKFYCHDCKTTFCSTCYITKHNKHDNCEIREIVGEFRKRLKNSCEKVDRLISQNNEQSETVNKQIKDITDKVDDAEKENSRQR